MRRCLYIRKDVEDLFLSLKEANIYCAMNMPASFQGNVTKSPRYPGNVQAQGKAFSNIAKSA